MTPTAALALLLLTAAPQTAPVKADRITFDQLVRCAATFRTAAVVAETEGQAELVEPALLTAAEHARLAYIYGARLGVPDPETDIAVAEDIQRRISRYGPLLGGPSDSLVRQTMETDQTLCRAVAERALRETGPVTGTS